MITAETIEEVKNRLVQTYAPLEIYLFGSYATGTPNEESDLDLLVVVETSDENWFRRPVSGYLALVGLDISKDILVYTKEEFDRLSADVTSFVHKIKKRARKLI